MFNFWKTLLCTFFLLFLYCTPVSSQIRKIYLDVISQNNETVQASFYSPNEGFVASVNDGSDWIGYTTDSGRTIQKRYISNIIYQGVPAPGYLFSINGIKAFNNNNLLVYGLFFTTPAILRSTDGGLSYEMTFYSLYNDFYLHPGITDMIFPDNTNTGFAIDADRILKTTNQGISWSVVYIDPQANFDQIEAVSNNVLFVSTSDKTKILKTTNGGSTWGFVNLPLLPGRKLNSTSFVSSVQGWISLSADNIGTHIYSTNDGGLNWQSINDWSGYFYKMKFLDNTTGYGLSGQNTVWKTTDGGRLWEPLQRDNNYAYLGYSHVDFTFLSASQFWAYGYKNFMELTSNGGGTPLPKAFFKIDTAGNAATGIINLTNFSRPTYSCKWYVNNVFISSNYNASYTHNPSSTLDSIMLVVSNGFISDTLIQFQFFPSPISITSFSPVQGVTGTTITINGLNLQDVKNVYFGGVRSPYFTVISSSEVMADVGSGASGAVIVETYQNTYASLNGFIYLSPPQTSLPVSINDSILCKSEKVTVSIQRSEPGVRYEIIDSLEVSYGTGNGNGNTLSIISSPISESGIYRIKIFRPGYPTTINFLDKRLSIKVEKTSAAFTCNRINIFPGELVNFGNQSIDASIFNWEFFGGASITNSTDYSPKNIHYQSLGIKSVKLISASSNGCIDTLMKSTVNVYVNPPQEPECFAMPVKDEKNENSYTQFNPIVITSDDGYVISGVGDRPKLKGWVGRPDTLTENAVSYVAKFTSFGALKWVLKLKYHGVINGVEKDSKGNIYVIGYARVYSFLTLTNGDSIRIAKSPDDSVTHKINGFIVKIDSLGNYLWHSVITDQTPLNQCSVCKGGLPSMIKIQNDEIAVAGNFYARLSYYRNGVLQPLFSALDAIALENSYRNNFVFKIKEDGSLQWHVYSSGGFLNKIALDNKQNLFITGTYGDSLFVYDRNQQNRIVFASDNPGNGYTSGYFLKFDSSGKYAWYNDFKTITVNDIAVDEKGMTYLTGATAGFEIVHSSGFRKRDNIGEFIVLKFDTSGINKWITGVFSDTSYGASNYGNGKTIYYKNGRLYITAQFHLYNGDSINCLLKSLDSNHQSITFHTAEFAIINYDTLGILKRVARSGANESGYIGAQNISSDSKNKFWISGFAETTNGDSTSFIAFNHINPIGTEFQDGFYMKLDTNYCYEGPPPAANAGNDKSICTGETVTLGTNAGSNSYYWTSSPIGFTSTEATPSVSPLQNTTYYLTVINQAGLIARDTVNVFTTQTPMAFAGADKYICVGDSVRIGSLPISGNIYSWTSIPAGFASSLSNLFVKPLTTTQYILSVTNGTSCIGRDTVTIEVNDSYLPWVAAGASATYICSNTNVTFTAVPYFGGDAPSFQWQVNGINRGTNSSIFSSSSLNHNDQVQVKMTSSYSCASPATVTSNTITMFVVPVVIPDISIFGNTSLLQAQSTNITASVVNGGSSPLFRWEDSTSTHGWEGLYLTSDYTISFQPQHTGHKLRCILMRAAECANPSKDTSNVLTFIINTATAVGNLSNENRGFKFYPNPVKETLVIDSLSQSDNWVSLEVFNNSGVRVLFYQQMLNQRRVTINTKHLLSGVYFAILRNKDGRFSSFKFIKY